MALEVGYTIMIDTVQWGEYYHAYDVSGTTGDLVSQFSSNPLPASWEKIDLSGLIPEGVAAIRYHVDAIDATSYERYIYGFTIDTSEAVTATYNEFGRLLYNNGESICRDVIWIDVPVNKDRENWIAAYNSTSLQPRIYAVWGMGIWIP